MDKKTEQIKNAYDLIAEKFSLTRSRLWPGMEELGDLVTEGRVLDLGCGNGRLFEVFENRPEIDYLGMDVSPQMIEIAKKKYPKAKFEVADLNTYNLKPKTYSAVFMVASYHHIMEKGQRMRLLKNIHEALEDGPDAVSQVGTGGVMVLTIWNLWNKKTMKKVRQSWWRKITRKESGRLSEVHYPFYDEDKVAYRPYKMFLPGQLERELKKAGFTIFKKEVWKNGQNKVFYCKKR